MQHAPVVFLGKFSLCGLRPDQSSVARQRDILRRLSPRSSTVATSSVHHW